jgi:putative membrane protein
MYYDGYHFWGMHLIWWLIWFIFLIWVFATPYYLPRPINNAGYLTILKNRFASGEISQAEYEEKKRILKGN